MTVLHPTKGLSWSGTNWSECTRVTSNGRHYNSLLCEPYSGPITDEQKESPLHSFRPACINSVLALCISSQTGVPVFELKYRRPITSIEQVVQDIYSHHIGHITGLYKRTFVLKIVTYQCSDGNYAAEIEGANGSLPPEWRDKISFLQDQTAFVGAANLFRDQLAACHPKSAHLLQRLPLRIAMGIFLHSKDLVSYGNRADHYTLSIDTKKILQALPVLIQRIREISLIQLKLPISEIPSQTIPFGSLHASLQHEVNTLAIRCLEQTSLAQSVELLEKSFKGIQKSSIQDHLIHSLAQSLLMQFVPTIYAELKNPGSSFPRPLSPTSSDFMQAEHLVQKIGIRPARAPEAHPKIPLIRPIPDQELDGQIKQVLQASPYAKKGCFLQ